MSLSRLWQHQGKKEEARQLLAEIYGWFTERRIWYGRSQGSGGVVRGAVL